MRISQQRAISAAWRIKTILNTVVVIAPNVLTALKKADDLLRNESDSLQGNWRPATNHLLSIKRLHDVHGISTKLLPEPKEHQNDG